MTKDQPFDIGLQAERTLLAWQRTCLSLAIANAFMIRYAVELFGAWATIVGVTGLLLCLAAYAMAARRYRRAHVGLVEAETLATDARMPSLLALSVVLAAVVGLVVVSTTFAPWNLR